MSTKISIIGSGATGIQVAVYLLEQFPCEINIFDSDTDYARGMALDCMQASAIRDWLGTLNAVDSIKDLSQADILIVTENNQNEIEKEWVQLAKSIKCTIFAGKNTTELSHAIAMGLSENALMGVHGMVDAKQISELVARELNISINDVHTMVYGGVGKDLKSKPELIRVHGIPINLISEGVFERTMDLVQIKDSYNQVPWGLNYTLAAAAVELALIMLSGRNAILPITGKDGTRPSMVGNFRIMNVYNDKY